MGSGPVDSQSNQNAEMAVSTRPLSTDSVSAHNEQVLIKSIAVANLAAKARADAEMSFSDGRVGSDRVHAAVVRHSCAPRQ